MESGIKADLNRKKISRYGAYGVVFCENKLLLVFKKSGPYKGLWDLPGGKIEFGETPELTLKRELKEEAALDASQLELIHIDTYLGNHINEHEKFKFHHIGIIYHVKNTFKLSDVVPEEEIWWASIDQIRSNILTPFLKRIFNRKDCDPFMK